MAELVRHLRPSHFSLKIQSYSLLVDNHLQIYESGIFEAGGYKWRLIFYPLWKNQISGTNHISLYLRIAESEAFPPGWEVNVCFKLFVLDQIRDKYFTIKDAEGEVKRFHAMKTEWGFPEFLSVDTFKNHSKGYLVNDSCVFGAEVFVVQCTGRSECFSMVKPPSYLSTYTWKIENFAACNMEDLDSDTFEIGGRTWKLGLYPKGETPAKDSLSLYLHLVDLENLPTKGKVYASYKLRILDQQHSKHYESNTVHHWFDALEENWGYPEFILLKDLKDASKGYIVKDSLVVEVQFLAVSATTSISQVKQEKEEKFLDTKVAPNYLCNIHSY